MITNCITLTHFVLVVDVGSTQPICHEYMMRCALHDNRQLESTAGEHPQNEAEEELDISIINIFKNKKQIKK